jgi:glutaredoxin 3
MTAEVVIYSTGWCPYCMRARTLLERKGIAYREVDVDDADRRAEMVAATGRRTVPQVFVGKRHVGGYEELYALDRSGELDGLLKEDPQ